MIYLYHGSGAGDILFGGEPLSTQEWERLRQSVCRLLKSRRLERAAELLETIPFKLFDATNGFGDEFSVLYARVPFDLYTELVEQYEEPQTRLAFRRIAEAITEVGPYIRFIVARLDTEKREVVSPPNLRVTSETVERALSDAEYLINSQGAVSSVDRVHTAFHGYLRVIASKANINVPDDASIIQIFKAIREQHPAFADSGPRAEDITRIVRTLANILDALNSIRNRASIAHPNEKLLEEPEAMLVVNTVRTLLHYLDAKLAKLH
jgi:hypothetical protein